LEGSRRTKKKKATIALKTVRERLEGGDGEIRGGISGDVAEVHGRKI